MFPEALPSCLPQRMTQSVGVQDWLNANTLFASLIWGSVGFGYFIYGKKQRVTPPLIGGILMIAVSYLVPDWLWMTLINLGLVVAVWYLSK
jgi:hypothetical protein